MLKLINLSFGKTFYQTDRKEIFKENDFIALDSMSISAEEVRYLKKYRNVNCPVCGDDVHFRSGFVKKNGEEINPCWFHKKNGKENCYSSEGLSHALIKNFVFQKMTERGYQVKEQKRYKFGDKFVRADVAVLEEEKESKNEVLKLVVEVQASNTTESEVKKRIAAYFQENAPVAWVLFLEGFFENYKMDTGQKYNSESGEYEDAPVLPNKEYPFYLVGGNSPVFNLVSWITISML
jgi:competence CoiA-like predicted nuclease